MRGCEVYLASDPVNAEIAKDLLKSHGIEAYVRSQHLWGGMGELPTNVYPSVWIEDVQQYAEARRIIADFESAPASSGRTWRCPRCGETLDDQFLQCWHCQTFRPAE